MPRRSTVVRGLLGEVSGSSSENDFQSPDREANQTDYGLEFTNSRVMVNPFEPVNSREERSRTESNTGETPSRRVQPPSRKKTSLPPRKSPRFQSPHVRPSLEPVVGARRRKKTKPYKRVLKDIKFLMKTTHLLIPRLPFGRLVKEILTHLTRPTEVTRITAVALDALHQSAEVYVTQQLQDAYTLTLHRGRVTLSVKDMELLRFLRGL